MGNKQKIVLTLKATMRVLCLKQNNCENKRFLIHFFYCRSLNLHLWIHALGETTISSADAFHNELRTARPARTA